MSRMSFILALLVLHWSRVIAAASDTIPLDQIWAYKMPGTHAIDEAGKELDSQLLDAVFRSSMKRADKMNFRDMARPGFAVKGTGLPALRAAHSVFVERTKPSEKFSPDDELSIVFFSEPSDGNHAQIQRVVRTDNRFEIQYRLEPYLELYISQSFAIIPVGRLPAGDYHVEMRQLPRDEKYSKWRLKPVDEDWSHKVLCKPFVFRVTK